MIDRHVHVTDRRRHAALEHAEIGAEHANQVWKVRVMSGPESLVRVEHPRDDGLAGRGIAQREQLPLQQREQCIGFVPGLDAAGDLFFWGGGASQKIRGVRRTPRRASRD